MCVLLVLHTLSGLHRCPNKIVIFLSNFMMLYSPWTQKFSGIIFSSAFSVWSWIQIKDSTLLWLMSHILLYRCTYAKSLKTQQIAQEVPSLPHYYGGLEKKNLLLLTKAFRFPLVNKQLIHFASLFGTKSLSQ